MSHKVCIIAEIAQAHDGSLGILHSYIDALAGAGADVIKFQTHIAEAESSSFEPFRVKFSYVDKTRYDYWARMQFTPEQWKEIKVHCDKVGIEFLSSPFSNAAVDLLEGVGVKRYKVGSGETTNFLLLEKIARTGKDIIISSGMSNYKDMDMTVEFLKPFGNKVSLLQCTTKYPTGAEDIGLNVISEMKARYGLPVGLSDHSGAIYPGIAAAALGAEIVEVHAVFDRRMFGPDASSSLSIDEIKKMVEGIRFIEKSLSNPIDKTSIDGFEKVREIFGKSIALNKSLPKGHIIRYEDLETKKPYGMGVPAKEYRSVIGKILSSAKNQWDFLKEEDLE